MSDDQPRDEQPVAAGADDMRLWSVTTILGESDSNRGLIEWSKGEVAKAAVASLETLTAMARNEGEEAAVAWLRGATDRPGRRGERTNVQLGSAVHAACEDYALSGIRPEVDSEVAPFLDRFEEWCQRFSPAYEAAEMTVYSPTYGYAGTLDAVLKVDGMSVVTDYKTSRNDRDSDGKLRRPYPRVALQLAAYRYAELAAAWRPVRSQKQWSRRYYLLSPEEQTDAIAVPPVDGGLCLYITPARCEAYPARCDESIYEMFLFCVEVARWREMAPRVLGEPLVGETVDQ